MEWTGTPINSAFDHLTQMHRKKTCRINEDNSTERTIGCFNRQHTYIFYHTQWTQTTKGELEVNYVFLTGEIKGNNNKMLIPGHKHT